MDAILSIDTSRGNKIINLNGYAITPTVKEGWILKVADDLLQTMEYTTGASPAVVPITMQDITPTGMVSITLIVLCSPQLRPPVPLLVLQLRVFFPFRMFTGVSSASQIVVWDGL